MLSAIALSSSYIATVTESPNRMSATAVRKSTTRSRTGFCSIPCEPMRTADKSESFARRNVVSIALPP